jgi:GNAT superfamily N-acetyltransferase
VRRDLGDGFVLDDDPARVDIDAVHAYLCNEAYWALGRPREQVERLVRDAQRVVSLFHDGRQIGFCRAVSDYTSFVYLADVYVLEEYRGRGLGLALVREMVDGSGELLERKWLLHTKDAHDLYRKLGFGEPGPRVMELRPEGAPA